MGTHLHVGAAVQAMAEGAEGVDAVLGVEVTAGGDGVLGAVGRCAVTRRQGVVLEVIVSGN